jgi:integrase/recombinase XerD
MSGVALLPQQIVAQRPQRTAALQAVKDLVLDSVRSPHTRRAYDRVLSEFLAWRLATGADGFTKATVQSYRAAIEARGLSASAVNVQLAAVRKLAAEATDNGLLAPELAAGIAKIPGARSEGPRAGNWLTAAQASQLLSLPDPATVKGKRDRAILGLLVGCGLRRDELVRLQVEDLQQREGRWVVVDLLGKGRKRRTVPVPGWVKSWIDEWRTAAGVHDGCVFRAINKGGRVYGDGLTANVIWCVVQAYAAELGVPKLAPHDLRRTCAKLCRAAGGDLEQIQLLLGHASIATTERYLGTKQNLVEAVNDRLAIPGTGIIPVTRAAPFSKPQN